MKQKAAQVEEEDAEAEGDLEVEKDAELKAGDGGPRLEGSLSEGLLSDLAFSR